MTRARQAGKEDGPSTPVPEHANIPPEPTQDAIARRAYELFCERGCANGQDVEDWLQAEQELRNGESG